MRPLVLKIAGLHSFREEQTIPFAELGELGVFGIFGPTGSGKSSILDAMTLALYGTVVRAGRRTQGILNHAEKHIKVSLTFSLGQKEACRIYRVERRYARKDQLAVTSTHSRLVAVLDAREEVLADKDREVTDKVTELLGLREEDFTRAVVLPQGRFAEFLNLGGRERREMLQRLFSLEQYGNVLINKVNDRYKTAELSYIEVESEQKGLGDASPAAVAVAEASLTAARQAETAAQLEYQAAEQQYNVDKEVYALQSELVKKANELAVHRRHQPAISDLAVALEVAAKAARAATVLDEFLAVQAEAEVAAASRQTAAERAVQLAEAARLQTTAYTKARQVRLEKEPALIERRANLVQAANLEREVIELRQTVQELARHQAQQQQACKSAGQALEQQALQGEALSAAIKKLEQQVASASVGSGLRTQAQRCQAAAQSLTQSMAAAERLRQYGVERKQQLAAAQAAAAQAGEWLRQAEQQVRELEAAEAKAAEQQLQAATARLDQLVAGEKQAAAARLADDLRPGQACPVCGATSHPRPAGGRQAADSRPDNDFTQEIMAAKSHIAELTRALAETGKLLAAERQQLDQARTAAAALHQQVANANTELDKLRAEYLEARELISAELAQLTSALRAAGRILPADVSAQAALAEAQAIQEYIAAQDRLGEALLQQLAETRKQYEQCQAAIPRLQRTVQAEEAALAALAARYHSFTEQEQAKQQELFAVTGGVPASQLAARVAQELETVRREESLAQERMEQAATAVAEAEQTKARADAGWQQTDGRRKGLHARLDARLAEEGFADVAVMEAALLSAERQEEYRRRLKDYTDTEQRLAAQGEQLAGTLNGRSITDEQWEQSKQRKTITEAVKNAATEQRVEADKAYRDLAARHQRWTQLEAARAELKDRKDCLLALRTVLRGNVFVEFLAQEQMELVARQASERLKQITQHRYALEMSSDGGFLIRDDANGGVRRPVSTLSGGETFQASLALALALSAQIQLKGKYPLEFFFLDEGFGSLDQYALDVAMSTLERLHLERLTIGVISHVAELRQRMPRRLLVEPAQPAGRGSYVRMEEA